MTFLISNGLPRTIPMALVMMLVAGTSLSTPVYAQIPAGATPGAAKAGTTPPAAASKADAKATCQRYVAILSGVGGWSGAVAVAEIDPRVRNGALGFTGATQDLPNYTVGGNSLLVFGVGKSQSSGQIWLVLFIEQPDPAGT